MDDRQQRQTLSYFSEMAGDWRAKAEGRVHEVNVITQRNAVVVVEARRRAVLRRALDVGCGTGELVCELAAMGAEAIGVDLAPEMVELSRTKAAAEGATGASFVHASIFDYTPEGVFDLIAANGFIEYISPDQLREFLVKVRVLLAPGGTFVVGSRNRLFNAFSLNDYTRLEIEAGSLQTLVEEALILADVPGAVEAVDALRDRQTVIPPFKEHPSTGIGVATRHQYVPSEMMRMCADAGLRPARLAGVHFHGVGAAMAKRRADLHAPLAHLIFEQAAESPQLLPFSSTFMLTAEAV